MATGGLRERKNAQTREAIERAALELSLEKGFEHTTVDEIAERADVSPRTVFGRYPTKEAIVFGDTDEAVNEFETALDTADGDTLDRVATYLHGMIDAGEEDELAHLRLQAMLTDQHLRQVLLGRLDIFDRLVSKRLATELKLAEDDVRVRTFGASVTGLLRAIADRAFVDPEGIDARADLESGLAFLRAGLDQLRDA